MSRWQRGIQPDNVGGDVGSSILLHIWMWCVRIGVRVYAATFGRPKFCRLSYYIMCEDIYLLIMI